MYANNVLKLLALFGAKGELDPDWNDEIVIGVTVALTTVRSITPPRPRPWA
jgi:NAD/NADP transhydrogenase alpha subunit